MSFNPETKQYFLIPEKTLCSENIFIHLTQFIELIQMINYIQKNIMVIFKKIN